MPEVYNIMISLPIDQNKPNGQFYLRFNRESILSFVHDLPIRKLPGVGRVNERLLESLGVKVNGLFSSHPIIQLIIHF